MIKTQTISTKDFFENSLKKVNLTSSRKELLLRIAETIAKEYSLNEVVHLNFICTHNSRRSQLGQVWSFYAAHNFGLNIKSFSGGTEVTAFFRMPVFNSENRNSPAQSKQMMGIFHRPERQSMASPISRNSPRYCSMA